MTPEQAAVIVNPDEVIRRLIELGRPIMLQHWAPDSCVAATRVGLDVLTHYGINDAHEVSVGVLALNAPAAIHMANGEAIDIPKWNPIDGSWAVNCAWLAPTNPWKGHLVILRQDKLIDLSLDQWSRPAYNMVFAAGSFEVPVGFGPGQAEFHLSLPNGTAIWYKAWPDDQGFQPSPDWNAGPLADQIRTEVIAAIDAGGQA